MAALLAVAAVPSTATTIHRSTLSDGTHAVLDASLDLYLEATPRRGQGWLAFAREHCGTAEFVEDIQRASGRDRLLVGVRYRIPFALLTSSRQLEVIAHVFAEDRGVATGWQHRVGQHGATAPESLWRISEWFTGRGDNYKALREANALSDEQVDPQQVVLVPARLLRPALRQVLPEESAYHLRYAEDGSGEYAGYRLKPREALYSSVVVRFTGLVFAEDVNQLAAEIASRSGIGDVTDIPVGYEVKIPFEVLMPEFLPAGHPARREYETNLIASARYSNRVEAEKLRGVTIIVDSGHGGQDVGASIRGVWESVYAYDIAQRIRKVLEETTAARVFSTTRDESLGGIPDRDRLEYSRGHRVLTTPEYPISDSTTGVNLRWYLANSIFRKTVSTGGDADRVVFLSVHADSLHSSIRGAMAYIPGSAYRGGSYGKSGPVYASTREVLERPTVSFSRRQLVKSEGLSRQMANELMAAFEKAGLEVHPDKPVRDRIVRSRRRAWVPAVLRYNEVPAQLLLEVCNLNNDEDRQLLQTREYRQRVAEVVVEGVLAYYDSDDDSRGPVAP